jgi:SPP1 gp7 family putative phage head morphogenesis protein
VNYHPRFGQRTGFAYDRKKSSAKSLFIRAKKLERDYARRLRGVARHVGDIVRGFDLSSQVQIADILAALQAYAKVITPWANAVAGRMVAEVAQSEAQAWRKTSAALGRSLTREIETAPTGTAMRAILADQVKLITSLPIEAGERVHKLTIEGIANGTRAAEIAQEIMRTGEVTKSRATLIARTEVSRTATTLTQVRAQHVGSTHFIWRTVGDSDVRPSHRKLNGKAFRWDDPPECDPGHRALPGAIWNCRCYPEPILPED